MEDQARQRQNEIYAKDRIIQEKETDNIIARNEVDRAKALATDRQTTIEAYR